MGIGADATNACVSSIKAMPALRRLHVANTGISTEGLLELRYVLPYCEVTPITQ